MSCTSIILSSLTSFMLDQESVVTNINGLGALFRVWKGCKVLPVCLRFDANVLEAPDSTPATMPHDLHRRRRAPLNPYFSKASIRRLEPVISETVRNLLERLDRCAQEEQILPITYTYKAATSDVISEYCFGVSTGYLMRDDYNMPFFNAVAFNLTLSQWKIHISWLGPLVEMIPLSIMTWMVPDLAALLHMR